MVKRNRALLRPAEAGQRLGVCSSRIYQLIQARELPATKVGGAWRIPVAALDRWLEDRAAAALASVRPRSEATATGR